MAAPLPFTPPDHHSSQTMGIITHFHLGTTLDSEDMWAAQDELDACLSTALPSESSQLS